MQNIDRTRQIHNEGVIKMQIACLLVLLWCMAQDPRACIPLALCWLGGRKETELGKMNGQSYHRPVGWDSLSWGSSKERQWLYGNGRHCKNRQPCTRWTPDFSRISESSWSRGRTNNNSSVPQLYIYFGETDRSETFCKLVKLDIKMYERHCIKIY